MRRNEWERWNLLFGNVTEYSFVCFGIRCVRRSFDTLTKFNNMENSDLLWVTPAEIELIIISWIFLVINSTTSWKTLSSKKISGMLSSTSSILVHYSFLLIQSAVFHFPVLVAWYVSCSSFDLFYLGYYFFIFVHELFYSFPVSSFCLFSVLLVSLLLLNYSLQCFFTFCVYLLRVFSCMHKWSNHS